MCVLGVQSQRSLAMPVMFNEAVDVMREGESVLGVRSTKEVPVLVEPPLNLVLHKYLKIFADSSP
jgi:hypothetical protein